MSSFESRSVSWWPVHRFVAALVAQANTALPAAGTPAWQAVADGDPRKLLAVAVAGEHHVLRMETAQEQLTDTAKAVARSADWPKVAREIQQRRDARRSGARIERSRNA